MIAKIVVLLAAFAAAHALGIASPWLGAGYYGSYGTGAVAPIGYAGAYGLGAYGQGAYGLGNYGLGSYGYGYAGSPLAYGHGGVLGSPYTGVLGYGIGLKK